MRISDWSSDVCSSDLIGEGIAEVELSVWHVKVGDMVVEDQVLADVMTDKAMVDIPSPVHGRVIALGALTSVVYGKSVSVRVDLGGLRIINKHNITLFTLKVATSIKNLLE